VDEKLAVALGPKQAGWSRPEDPQPQLDRQTPDRRDDPAMLFGITDHATLSDLALPNLELRFQQSQDFARAGEQRRKDRKNLREGDEGEIDGDKLGPLPEVGRRERTRMGPLHDHNPRISPQCRIELTAPDVNRIDQGGPMLQQAVSEPPGGSSQVKADAPANRDAKRLQRALKLDPAAPHVRVFGSPKGDP
jgi:hypothetical protein